MLALLLALGLGSNGADEPRRDVAVARDFVRRWPNVAALKERSAAAFLRSGTYAASVSRDHRHLILVMEAPAPLLPAGAEAGETYLAGIDGPKNDVWTAKSGWCTWSEHVRWSKDGRRAIFGGGAEFHATFTFADFGARSAYTFVTDGIYMEGDLGSVVISPGFEHLAYRAPAECSQWERVPSPGVPWHSCGHELVLDKGVKVWGAGVVDGPYPFDLKWVSDSVLTFCGQPGRSAREGEAYEVRVDAAGVPAVTALHGPCSK
jgi:hypothetical protein